MSDIDNTQTIDPNQLAAVAGGTMPAQNDPWKGWHLPQGFAQSPFAQWLTSNYYGTAKPHTPWQPQGGWNQFRGYGGWGPRGGWQPYAPQYAHR